MDDAQKMAAKLQETGKETLQWSTKKLIKKQGQGTGLITHLQPTGRGGPEIESGSDTDDEDTPPILPGPSTKSTAKPSTDTTEYIY